VLMGEGGFFSCFLVIATLVSIPCCRAAAEVSHDTSSFHRLGVRVVASAMDPPRPIPNLVVPHGSAGEYCAGNCVGGEAAARRPQPHNSHLLVDVDLEPEVVVACCLSSPGDGYVTGSGDEEACHAADDTETALGH
jgi:hypothetical protein